MDQWKKSKARPRLEQQTVGKYGQHRLYSSAGTEAEILILSTTARMQSKVSLTGQHMYCCLAASTVEDELLSQDTNPPWATQKKAKMHRHG